MPGIVRMHTLTCITTSHIFLRRRAESFRPIEKILYKNIKSKMIHIGLRIKISCYDDRTKICCIFNFIIVIYRYAVCSLQIKLACKHAIPSFLQTDGKSFCYV